MALTRLTNRGATYAPTEFDTVADFKASLTEFADGHTVRLKDRGADFVKISGQSGNGFRTIPSTSISQSIVLTDTTVIVEHWIDSSMTATVRTQGIQAAIEYAAAQEMPLKASGSGAINGTLIIPQRSPSPTFELSYKQIYDFGAYTFVLGADLTVLTSGYDNAGTLETNVGTAPDSHFSDNIKLICGNMQSSIGQIIQPALAIQDWHQGCVIRDFSSSIHQQAGKFINCFYTEWYNMYSTTVGSKVGDRWVWEGSINLCKISRFVAGNSVTGYTFDGPITATVMSNMSFEGMTIGAEFNSFVYDCEINHSYFEGVSDTMIVTTDSAASLTLTNNYFNFLSSATTYLLNYFAAPSNGISIDESNHFISMPSDANLIKVKEDVYGEGINITRAKAIGTLSDILVDNTVFGGNIRLEQLIRLPGAIANKNNTFAVGNYSGKHSTGKAIANGFTWIDNSNNTLTMDTKIIQNFIQLVYVNIQIVHSAGPTDIAGVFVGNAFYEFDGVGLNVSSNLTGATDAGGFFRINGGIFFNASVTGAVGEVRLV